MTREKLKKIFTLEDDDTQAVREYAEWLLDEWASADYGNPDDFSRGYLRGILESQNEILELKCKAGIISHYEYSQMGYMCECVLGTL